MTRVLHLIPTLEGGGAERQLCMLAAEHVRRGWDVHVGIRRGGTFEQSLRKSGVRIHNVGDHKSCSPLLLISLNLLIKRIAPDVVQTWLPQMDVIGGIAALWGSVPWVISERSSELAFETLGFVGRLRVYTARHAKVVVANSSGGVAYWRTILGPHRHIVKIPNAVDVQAIRTAASMDTKRCRREKHFLVVGRLAAEKALDTVIRAVHLVASQHQIHVSIIGDGPLRNDLKDMIANAGVLDHCSLFSYRTDWWTLLGEASALVSVSRFEGHPNVVLEAAAAACPLIVSDIPAHREFLDEETAILVRVHDSAALAGAMISLLADPESARARAARAAVNIERFNIAAAAGAYEDVYREAIRGGCT